MYGNQSNLVYQKLNICDSFEDSQIFMIFVKK